ncbi:hypothetical protein J4Q44_G00281410 [Coregonus suidteri]|uniref:Uncharacterized protein n=1 Tax=Coregonus suidteri TaxID=861788 RepID=A0AAN8QLE9_9TELE
MPTKRSSSSEGLPCMIGLCREGSLESNEGCLMEDKMAWMRVHMELVDNHKLAQDMNATLEKARACRSELLSRLSVDGNGIPYHCDSKLKGDTGGKGGEGLKSISVSELMTKLELYEEELDPPGCAPEPKVTECPREGHRQLGTARGSTGLPDNADEGGLDSSLTHLSSNSSHLATMARPLWTPVSGDASLECEIQARVSQAL